VTRLACALFAFIVAATFSGTRVREPTLFGVRAATTNTRAIPAMPAGVAAIRGEHTAGMVRLAEDDAPRSRHHHSSGIAASANALIELRRLTGRGTISHACNAAENESACTYDANAPPVVA
jgi:hypothetical protein